MITATRSGSYFRVAGINVFWFAIIHGFSRTPYWASGEYNFGKRRRWWCFPPNCFGLLGTSIRSPIEWRDGPCNRPESIHRWSVGSFFFDKRQSILSDFCWLKTSFREVSSSFLAFSYPSPHVNGHFHTLFWMVLHFGVCFLLLSYAKFISLDTIAVEASFWKMQLQFGVWLWCFYHYWRKDQISKIYAWLFVSGTNQFGRNKCCFELKARRTGFCRQDAIPDQRWWALHVL